MNLFGGGGVLFIGWCGVIGFVVVIFVCFVVFKVGLEGV